MKDLSVIIVSWNVWEVLSVCLRSIEANMARLDGPDGLGDGRVETILVDNDSHDDTIARVRDEFPWVEVLENSANIGFAGANNQGIARSQGRHIVLLNPDTELVDDALGTLLTFMDEHPDVGAAGPLLLNADGSLQMSCYPFPNLRRELWRLLHLDEARAYGVYPVATWPRDVPRPIDTLKGACIIARRAVVDEIGLLDDGYFMYTEEVDWCYRIKQAGWSIYWVPSSTVIHYGGQSTRQAATSMFLHLYRSKLRFFRKHFGRLAGRLYKLILLVASLLRLLLIPVTILLRPTRRAEQWALAGRYARLVRELPGM